MYGSWPDGFNLIPLLVIFCVFIVIPVILLGTTVFGWLWDAAKVIMLAPIRAPIWIWQELSGARLLRVTRTSTSLL